MFPSKALITSFGSDGDCLLIRKCPACRDRGTDTDRSPGIWYGAHLYDDVYQMMLVVSRDEYRDKPIIIDHLVVYTSDQIKVKADTLSLLLSHEVHQKRCLSKIYSIIFRHQGGTDFFLDQTVESKLYTIQSVKFVSEPHADNVLQLTIYK